MHINKSENKAITPILVEAINQFSEVGLVYAPATTFVLPEYNFLERETTAWIGIADLGTKIGMDEGVLHKKVEDVYTQTVSLCRAGKDGLSEFSAGYAYCQFLADTGRHELALELANRFQKHQKGLFGDNKTAISSVLPATDKTPNRLIIDIAQHLSNAGKQSEARQALAQADVESDQSYLLEQNRRQHIKTHDVLALQKMAEELKSQSLRLDEQETEK